MKEDYNKCENVWLRDIRDSPWRMIGEAVLIYREYGELKVKVALRCFIKIIRVFISP